MKLGIVITGLGTGGAENHLLKVLPKLDIPLFVISLTNLNDVGKLIEKEGVKVYYLGLRKNLSNILGVVLRFRAILKKERPNILNSYLIHANLFTRFFGRLFGIKKIICSVRNKHIHKSILNKIDRMSSKLVNLYLPNSESVGKFIINYGIPKSKVKVLTNGVDLDKFNFTINKERKQKDLNIDKDNFIMTCVASLTKQKNHETLLKAISKIKDTSKIKLLLVGDGNLHDSLKELTHELNIDKNVIFLGKRNDVIEILKITDLFILPSLHEGMSNALLEAMAAGCTCLVSDIEENKELIKDKKFRFAVYNYNELSSKINKYIAYKQHNSFDMTRYDINEIIAEFKEIIGKQ